MHHPGPARWTHSDDAQTLLLGLAHLCLTMEFLYQVAIQVYNTLACVGVFVLATGIASGDYSSNAFLKEAAASKQAMPGSASVAAKAKSGDWFALHSLAYTCTLLLFVVLVRRSSRARCL